MPGTRKLGKTTDQRMAMLRQQVTDLLEKGRMETTITRAKEVRPLAEKMITLGKKNTLASRRAALAFITKEDVVTKVFSEIAPRYAERNGGYTRIMRWFKSLYQPLRRRIIKRPVSAFSAADMGRFAQWVGAAADWTCTERRYSGVDKYASLCYNNKY